MCFYFQMSADAQTLENRFKKSIKTGIKVQDRNIINGFEHPNILIITNKSTAIEEAEWGLIPLWAKDKTIQKLTLNARIETLTQKPSFKNYINNRCLIPATGFFEWHWLDQKGKTKEKYLIQVKNETLFAFAGLYNDWVEQSSGRIISTCTIITTQANELMSRIHNTKQRMPVVLKTHDETDWLAGKELNFFASPYQTELNTIKQ